MRGPVVRSEDEGLIRIVDGDPQPNELLVRSTERVSCVLRGLGSVAHGVVAPPAKEVEEPTLQTDVHQFIRDTSRRSHAEALELARGECSGDAVA